MWVDSDPKNSESNSTMNESLRLKCQQNFDQNYHLAAWKEQREMARIKKTKPKNYS